MKKLLAASALVAMVSGCVDIYYTSNTVVKKQDSPAQRVFPRGEYVFACTTMTGLYYYLDNNIVVEGCGEVEMTAVTERGSYDSYEHGRVRIYQFMRNGYLFFTYYKGRRYRY
jgi:hypothetical protein